MYEEADLMDIIMEYAEHNDWPCNRPDESTVTIEAKGVFTTYIICCSRDRASSLIHLLCSFECQYPDRFVSRLRHLVELCTKELWRGTFVRIDTPSKRQISYKYGLILTDGIDREEVMDELLTFMPQVCDYFYPAFLAVASGEAPAIAFKQVIAETLGTA